jgi:hypothetical protein
MQTRKRGVAASLGRPLAVAILYVLAALATTHPLWLHLAEAVPSDIGDPLLNTWVQAWDAHALLTDPLHLFDANVFYPLPDTLAYSEHLISTAVLVLPLQVFTGEPIVAYNLSLLASFPLAAMGMYWLFLRWTGRRGPAFVAGLAFAFAPYRLAAIAHLQLLTVQWLPLSILSLDRLLGHRSPEAGELPSRHRWQGVVVFVVFATLQILASWYLAVFTVLILGLYALGWLVAHRPARGAGRAFLLPLARLALAGLIVVGLTLPFALPYLRLLPQLQAARPVTWAASFAAKPTDLLAAAPFLRVAGPLTREWAARPGFTEENTLFPGIVALPLALIGLGLGRPRWRIAVLGVALGASLALTFGGPYLALTRLFPPLAIVRVPPRWIIPATLALAALAGYGVQSIKAARLRHPVIILVSLLLIVESFAAPLPLAAVGSQAERPPVYRRLVLAEQRSQGAVVELPMHVAPAPEYPETKRMLASTLGWWGLVNGYSGFTPDRQMALGERLAGFPDSQALAALRELAGSRVRFLVVHPDEAPLDRDRWETTDRWQAERQTTLLPLGQIGPDDLYLINPYGDGLVTDPAAIVDPYWSANAPVAADIRFVLPGSGGEIHLLAYLRPAAASGEPSLQTRLTLYWQTTTTLDTDYTVFVHSLSADGQMLGQADGPPVANHYPTTAWQPGEIVQDSRLVPDGERVRIGLYDATTGERLPAFAADGTRLVDDAAIIAFEQP